MRRGPFFTLLVKELTALRPYALVALSYIAVVAIELLTSTPPDMRPLTVTFPGEMKHTLPLALLWLLTFAVAQGLLVEEHDQGTLQFLDALPVSRRKIFLAKTAAGWLTMMIMPATMALTFVSLNALSANSIEQHQLWADKLALALLAHCLCVLCALSLGMVLGFTRSLAWPILVFLLATQHSLAPAWLDLELIDPTELLSGPFAGQRWLMPWRAFGVQALLTVALLATAYGLFLGGGQRLLAKQKALSGGRRGRALLGAASVALVAGAAILAARSTSSPKTEHSGSEDGLSFDDEGELHAHTGQLDLIFKAEHAQLAQAIISGGDDVASQVRALLQVPAGEPIVVDLRGSGRTSIGEAHWGKLTLDLEKVDDVPHTLGVLAHELTHLYIDRATDRRLKDKSHSAMLFHEGLADYVRLRLLAPELIAGHRAVAALKWRRELIKLPEVFSASAFNASQDHESIYPIGESFIAATVDLYGDGALPRLLEAAREPTLAELNHDDLWRAIYQQAGLSFDDAVAAWYGLLEAEAVRAQATLAAAPQLTAAAQLSAYEISLSPLGEPTVGILCRFREDSDTPPWRYTTRHAAPGHPCSLSRAELKGPSAQYQLGYRLPGAERPFYMAWQTLILD